MQLHKVVSILITFMVITVNSPAAYADDLMDEIDSLIRFISIQSNQDTVVKQHRHPSNIRAIIRKAAGRYSLEPALIEAIIKVESGFNPRAVSHKGAMGYMQLMPETAKEIGVTRPFDPYQNIMGGTYYYRLMLNRFRDHRKALYAYNCGPECVENGRIPKESRRYARKVIKVYKDLKQKGGKYVK